jgi:hypothetical protein
MKKMFVLALLAAFAAFGMAPAFAQTQSTLRPVFLAVDNGGKTATATAGAATLAKTAGVITSESLSTAAAGTYTLTITNSTVAAADQVFASVANGTNAAGLAEVATVTPGAGSIVVIVRNAHASAAFNGTLKISFLVIKN